MRPSNFLASPPRLIARATALLVATGGFVALLGYALNLPTLTSLGLASPAVHPFAALGFLFCAFHLGLAARAQPPDRFLNGSAIALKLTCAILLVAQLLGWALPFTPAARPTDGLFSLPPGPANLAMTLAFGCVALGMILRSGRSPTLRGWMFLPLLPVFWATYLALAANFYRIEHLNRYFTHTLIPLPAAILFALLLTGLLATQTHSGFMAPITSRHIGGLLARIAYPVILIVPFTVGWIRIQALRTGTYDLAAAFSQFATTNIVIFGTFIWLCAHMLNRIDARRQKTMESLQDANTELQRLNNALEAKIEEQQRTEDARKKTELQLFQSQKMEAMGTLASGIAHDFNNILTVILLNAESAAERAPASDAELRESLGEIRKAGTRAADLIRQIMTFGRKTPGKRTPEDPGAMVSEAVRLLRHTLPAGVQILTEIDAGVPPILVDSTQVQQVLLNLGTNARDAMEGSEGRLEIRVKTVTIGPERAALSPDLPEGRYVLVAVRDTGHGMDESTLKRVFDPFFTTKAPGKGTGLGLAVVHGIMRLHGGNVTAYSEPGRGTLFNLYFPIAQGAEDAPGKTTPTPPSFPRGVGQHVLCVDDDPAILAAIGLKMERLGYRVTRMDDPAAALQAFRAHPDAYDLLLTDHSMPGMSGRALAAEVLNLRPDLPIVLMSGFLETRDAESARKIGIRRVLLKPDAMEELEAVLHDLLRPNG